MSNMTEIELLSPFTFLAVLAIIEIAFLWFIKGSLKSMIKNDNLNRESIQKMNNVVDGNNKVNTRLCGLIEKQTDTFRGLENKVIESNTIIKERR